jgi:hypothetical protein
MLLLEDETPIGPSSERSHNRARLQTGCKYHYLDSRCRTANQIAYLATQNKGSIFKHDQLFKDLKSEIDAYTN